MKQILERYFSSFPDYWSQFLSEFSHNFFDAHIDRTGEYWGEFITSLKGKTVLEIGAFPGLETAALLEAGAKVTVMDSPKYNPDYYKEFLKKYEVPQIEHDIVAGAPDINQRWDAMVMSDVLLHVDGYPYDFLKWAIRHCDTFYMLNYPSGDSRANPAKGHDLKSGHPFLGTQAQIAFFIGEGAELVKIKNIAARDMLVFNGSRG